MYLLTETMRIGVGGMPDLPANGPRDVSDYRAGVADGVRCLRDGGIITKLRLIAINDLYSAGFRAGYFQRDR